MLLDQQRQIDELRKQLAAGKPASSSDVRPSTPEPAAKPAQAAKAASRPTRIRPSFTRTSAR